MTQRIARWIVTTATMLILAGCGRQEEAVAVPQSLDDAARDYVSLVLALAEHDPNFIVSYFGPEEIREAARAEGLALEDIAARASALAAGLDRTPDPDPESARRRHLAAQFTSVAVRAELLGGKRYPFMEEARLVFGATIPDKDARQYISDLHARIDRIMPGRGLLSERIESFRRDFIIPPERLPAVMEAAIEECRRRTHAAMDLPEERLEIEYASGVNWLTFNEYKGDGFSVIRINTDFPVYIDRAVDMGCHEGYPGHHISNVLKENALVDERGWLEFTVQTLFSPQTLVEEGIASFGVDLVFPDDERVRFERDVLFELAGFDRAQALRYLELMKLMAELSYADIEGARRLLDAEWDPGYTARWLINYRLLPSDRARQRLAVFETYRTFIAAGYVGRQLVHDYVTRRTGDGDDAAAWAVLRELMIMPVLPEDLGN